MRLIKCTAKEVIQFEGCERDLIVLVAGRYAINSVDAIDSIFLNRLPLLYT